MRPFGWGKWGSLYNQFKKNKIRSIERWGLRYLHSKYSLDSLAIAVAKRLGAHGIKCKVSVESIWIDGTPQAIATMPAGQQVQCELADLLFIIEETSLCGSSTKETGLLLQGKATPKYNKLTGGNSTKKERQLLEGIDRFKPIDLYTGTNPLKSSKIGSGSYILAGIPIGLEDCSRYLLMPKFKCWSKLLHKYYAPFQIGWPKSRISPFLLKPKSIVQSIQDMILVRDIGKQIINPSICEWSRMINDLRGNYTNTQMNGYGGQYRINHSASILSFMSSDNFSFIKQNSSNYPPYNHDNKIEEKGDIPPSISIIKLNIQHFEQTDFE